ncbi:MAG: alpha/beta hydrolase [Demequina sp.]
MSSDGFDDDYRRASEWIRQLGSGNAADARPGIDTASLVARFPELASVSVDDLELTGPQAPVPARRYLAPHPRAGLVWVHGGGFVAGDLDMPESHWVSLALAAAGISVVALDYRKALNGVRYPTPLDDVLAGWREVRRRTGELGLPDAPLFFGGASAGASLAAGATVRLRASGQSSDLPAGLVLIYPLLHPTPPAPDKALAGALAALPPESRIPPGFARRLNENLFGPTPNATDPAAYPALAALEGFPPLLVVNADSDDLRPSGEDFAVLAQRAGVPAEVACETGTVHGYLDHPGSPGAVRTLARIGRWVLGGDAQA